MAKHGRNMSSSSNY